MEFIIYVCALMLSFVLFMPKKQKILAFLCLLLMNAGNFQRFQYENFGGSPHLVNFTGSKMCCLFFSRKLSFLEIFDDYKNTKTDPLKH